MRLAHRYDRASLLAIDNFFQVARRSFNLLDRSDNTATADRIHFIYLPFDPAMVIKMLDIHRVVFNYMNVSPERKTTPAMRLTRAPPIAEWHLLSETPLTYDLKDRIGQRDIGIAVHATSVFDRSGAVPFPAAIVTLAVQKRVAHIRVNRSVPLIGVCGRAGANKECNVVSRSLILAIAATSSLAACALDPRAGYRPMQQTSGTSDSSDLMSFDEANAQCWDIAYSLLGGNAMDSARATATNA